jgi:hypothetical protein
MPGLDGLALALVIGGIVLAIAAPFLVRVRLFLPLPETPFGRGAGLVSNEAFACALILSGITKLLGSDPLSDFLNGAKTIIFIVFAMAVIGGALAEATNPEKKDPGSE